VELASSMFQFFYTLNLIEYFDLTFFFYIDSISFNFLILVFMVNLIYVFYFYKLRIILSVAISD